MGEKVILDGTEWKTANAVLYKSKRSHQFHINLPSRLFKNTPPRSEIKMYVMLTGKVIPPTRAKPPRPFGIKRSSLTPEELDFFNKYTESPSEDTLQLFDEGVRKFGSLRMNEILKQDNPDIEDV